MAIISNYCHKNNNRNNTKNNMINKTLIRCLLWVALLVTPFAAKATPPCITNLWIQVNPSLWGMSYTPHDNSISQYGGTLIGPALLSDGSGTNYCQNARLITISQLGDCTRQAMSTCATVYWQCNAVCDSSGGVHTGTVEIPPAASSITFALILTPDAQCSIDITCVSYTLCNHNYSYTNNPPQQ